MVGEVEDRDRRRTIMKMRDEDIGKKLRKMKKEEQKSEQGHEESRRGR